MTSYELSEAIEDFLGGVRPDSILALTLKGVSDEYDRLFINQTKNKDFRKPYDGARRILWIFRRYIWDEPAEPPQPLPSSAGDIERIVTGLIATLKNNFSRALFTNIDALDKSLDKFAARLRAGDAAFFTELKELLARFASAYEDFIKEPKADVAMILFEIGRQLQTALHAAVLTLSVVRESLEEPREAHADDGEVTLLLRPESKLSTHVIKLQSLIVIYGELCRLLNVSVSEYPLTVAKLESGSLWLKLFGESKVVALLTDLVRASAGYMHRNFTKEGKLAAIPKNIEEIEAVVNLEERLRQQGFDTSDMRESIRLSGAVVAKQLNNLLAGEAVMLINKQVYSVGAEVERLYIEKSKALLLEEGRSAPD